MRTLRFTLLILAAVLAPLLAARPVLAQCPGTPTILATVPSACTITITWLPAIFATSYEVYRSTSPTFTDPPIATIGGTSYADAGLVPGTTYHYRVRGITSSGCPAGGPFSNTTSTAPFQLTVGTPTHFNSSSSCGSFTITWTAVPGATSYFCETYYFFIGQESPWGSPQTVTSPSFTYTGNNPPFLPMYIRVRAQNACGSGEPAITTALVDSNLFIPEDQTATRVPCGVLVNWSPLYTANTYNIYRFQDNQPFVAFTAAAPPFVDTGVPLNAQVHYCITATNDCGTGGPSCTFPVTVPSFSIIAAPESIKRSINDTGSLSVSAAGDGLTYQWRRNGIALVSAGRIAGATSPTLTISHLQVADTDLYDVQVSSPATGPGNLPVTLPASIIVTNTCPADFNDSGQTTIDDLFLYINAYFTGCP